MFYCVAILDAIMGSYTKNNQNACTQVHCPIASLVVGDEMFRRGKPDVPTLETDFFRNEMAASDPDIETI